MLTLSLLSDGTDGADGDSTHACAQLAQARHAVLDDLVVLEKEWRAVGRALGHLLHELVRQVAVHLVDLAHAVDDLLVRVALSMCVYVRARVCLCV